MKERLQQLLSDLGYTATRLADEIQVQRSGISHMLSGRNQPSYDFISRLLRRFPNVDARWLILGEGMMYLSEINEKKQNTRSQSDFLVPELPSDIPEGNMSGNETHNQVTNVTIVNNVLFTYADGTFEFYTPRMRH